MKRNFKIYSIILFVCFVLLPAGFAVAAYNDLISPGDSVTLGEFVYDDDANPTSSDCTISVYDPTLGDPAVVDGQTMSTSSGGWHYYTINSVNATGTWPAVMTCGSSATGDLAHLDKTFKVGYSPVSTTPIANDVWNNATRTLTDMNTSTVAAAVWNNNNRTLTDYATSSMVSAIWGVATSTFTTIGSVGYHLVTNLNSTISGIAASVWSNLNGITRSLTSALIGTGTENLATESNVNNASSSLANLIGGISLDTTGLATSIEITTLSGQLTAASSSLALTIPSNINANTNTTVGNASSSLFALLSGLMSVNTNTITDQLASNTNSVTSTLSTQIANASSSLSTQLTNTQFALTTTISNASSSLYSALNASILNSSSSLASLIGAISLDTTGLATTGEITALANQLTAASSSLAILIPSAINSTVISASSSLASLIGGISLDTSGLATQAQITTLANQLTSASTSLALTIPSNINSNTNSAITNASSSLFALLSSLMTSNTNTITGSIATNANAVTSTLSSQIADASSSLSTQLTNAQLALTTTINNVSSSLYSTLNASILSSSSSIASLISAISLDTSSLATSISIANLANQLTAASTSLAVAIPSSINVTINNTSSSLASLIAGITPPDTSALTTQINNASSSLAALITATGDTLGAKIDNASSSLAGQTVINGSLGSWNVAMSNVDRVLIGQKYKAKIYVTNYKSVPTNPSIVPKISLYNNNGDTITENISMTLGTSTGSYSYSYTIPDLSEGLWEAEVKTEVEAGKIITTNDYFAIEGSPAQVSVVDVIDKETPNIAAQVLITNEGLADYEYHYEWCVVSNVNYACRGGHDIFYGSASKLIEVGSSTSPILTAEGITPGNYYFKLVVYYGMEKSGSSRYFTATAPVTPATCGNGSCSGGETCSTCPSDCGACSPGGGGGGGGGYTPPLATTTPAVTCDGADFNHDKKVNSVDFSILLAFWKTAWPFKNSCVDINKDKQVNSVDFSILMYQWGKKIL